MTRRGAVNITFALAATMVAPARAAELGGDPNDVAARVHEAGGYPSELRIAPAPRWTPAPGPTIARVHPEPRPALPGRGLAGRTGAAAIEDAAGDAASGLAPQTGGGRLGDESDGWDGDPWAVPDEAQWPAVIDVYPLETATPDQPSSGEPCQGGQCPRPGASSFGGDGILVIGAEGEPMDATPRGAFGDSRGDANDDAPDDAHGGGATPGVLDDALASTGGDPRATGEGPAGATGGERGDPGETATGDTGATDATGGTAEAGLAGEDGGNPADGATGGVAEAGPIASSSSGPDTESATSGSATNSEASSPDASTSDGASESESGDEGTDPEEDAAPQDDDHVIALWLALLAAAGLGGWIARRLRRRRDCVRAAKTPAPTSPFAPTPAAAPEIAQIDYDAEIRALLRAGLLLLGWEPHGRALSLTAREIARSVHDSRTPPLAELVRVAELVRFAGIAADATLHERARAAYVAIRDATRGQGGTT